MNYHTSYPRLRASLELGITVEADAEDEAGESARRFLDHLNSHPGDFDWLASWLAGDGFGKADDFPRPLPPTVPLNQIRNLSPATLAQTTAPDSVPSSSGNSPVDPEDPSWTVGDVAYAVYGDLSGFETALRTQMGWHGTRGEIPRRSYSAYNFYRKKPTT